MKLNLDYYIESEDSKIIPEEYNEVLEKVNSVNSNFSETLIANSKIKNVLALSEIRENVLNWYNFKKNSTILEMNANYGEITGILCKEAQKVVSIEKSYKFSKIIQKRYSNQDNLELIVGDLENIKIDNKFDYIVIIGIAKDLEKYMEYAKARLNENGTIIIAVNNKFGIKSWISLKEENKVTNNKNTAISKSELKKLLKGFNYKFYYPLPDYKLPNIIYTEKCIPSLANIDRDLTYKDEDVNFKEVMAYREIIKDEPERILDFANSFLVEISKGSIQDSDIKFIIFSNIRKDKYRIKTIVKEKEVYKTNVNQKSKEHLDKIKEKIDILNKLQINTLDTYNEHEIISRYCSEPTLDKVLIETYKKNGKEEFIGKIKEYIEFLKKKLEIIDFTENNIFSKYKIDYDDRVKNLTYVKYGFWDLTFSNCFIINNEYFFYDQEWLEYNIPVEYIIYRAIKYFNEMKNYESDYEIFRILNITEYIEIFEELDNKIQKKIRKPLFWRIHTKDELIKTKIEKNKKIKEEFNNVKQEYQKLEKEYIEKNNEIQSIKNSFSWRITDPLRRINRKMNISYRIHEIKYYKRKYGLAKTIKKCISKVFSKLKHILKNKKLNTMDDYNKWIYYNEPNEKQLEEQQKTKFKIEPKISLIVPMYNTDEKYFEELVEAMINQTYSNWELCLADGSEKQRESIKKICDKDKRIKYKFLNSNNGISENTNEALKLATGDYIGLLDHDDLLPKFALYEVVKVINENPEVEFIYSDEDKFTDIKNRFDPHFKPDFAIDTLRSVNYICHFSVFKKELMNELGGFRSEFNGAQDYDIILRMSEKTDKIKHIPKILYHWRVHPGSTSAVTAGEAKPYAFEAGKRAIEEHYKRLGIEAKVEHGVSLGIYRTIYKVIGNPKVSIIIPNMDHIEELGVCINSILEKTTYSNYEIVIVENNSKKKETFEYYKKLIENEKIKVIYYPENKFNYSKIINFGVKHCNGEYIMQLNNDTELITHNWLEELLGYAQRKDIGAVGVKLYYPDNTIQHDGVIIGIGGVGGHILKNLPKGEKAYFSRESFVQNFSAVTAACIISRREIYEEVGYMDENFEVAFNDLDFCLKVRKAGYLIVTDPFVELIHYESKSRGYEDTPEKIKRFQGEIERFQNKWTDILEKGDPYFNKNFRLDTEEYKIKGDKV